MLQLAVVVLLLQSVFWTARIPVALKLATAALAALSFVHPGGGLLVVAGLVPFSNVLVTRLWDVYPLALAEVFVLAFLAGYLTRTWRWRETGEAWRDSLSTPANLFALVVLASCAVQFVVLQVWHDYPLAYAGRFLSYLVRDYLTTVPDPRPWVEGQGFVRTAALLLEGVALLLATRSLCRARPGLEGRMLRMVVAAGAGAALLNLSEVAEFALRGESVLGYERWTRFIASVDTSGPYLAMVFFVALGVASWRRLRLEGLATAALLVTAVWMTRTRSAILAVLATAIAGSIWLGATRTKRIGPLGAAATGAVAALMATLGVLAIDPWSMIRSDVYPWFHLRKLLAGTALRMLESHPIAGVGVGQYGIRYPDFATPELLAVHQSADAHNYFLWVAAELGLPGLLGFLWLLGMASWLAWRRLRADPNDSAFAGLCAGLGCFVVTWLTGQPLGIRIVACTFWILLGVAAHAANGEDPARWTAQGAVNRLTWRRASVPAFVVVMLISVPIRARQAIQTVDLARVSYGFHLWEIEESGMRYRWTGPRATFFERASVRAVELPLRALDPARIGTEAFEIRVFVNHRRVRMARLTGDRWQKLRVPAPDGVENDRFWRVDLEVSPAWRPARLIPGSTDPRTLGVMVGEIRPID